jgi:putative ABC transport system substrate-binding protein
MRRRDFITGLGGAAVTWPLAARAQQPPAKVRRIGVLLAATSDDSEFQAWVGAFQQGLAQSGWIIGRNVRIDTRWAGGKADDILRHATELAALAPDVILAHGATTVRPLLQATRSVPILFSDCRRSCRRRLRREPGPAGRQRHRIYDRGIQLRREMARTA